MAVTTVRSVRLLVAPLGIQLHMTGAEARRLDRLTTRLAGQPAPRCELAIIVNGRVIAQPTVAGPISGGLVEITVGSQAATERLYQQPLRNI